MKILLTGATGVIGRRVVPLALACGHEVTAIVRSPPKAAALGLGKAQSVQVDLFDPGAVMNAVAGHDIIVNLATHMPSSSARMLLRSAWRQNDRIRRLASRNLVAGARGSSVRAFVQESFAPVYPDCGDDWIDETVPINPARYNESIQDAEHSALGFSDGGRRGTCRSRAYRIGRGRKGPVIYSQRSNRPRCLARISPQEGPGRAGLLSVGGLVTLLPEAVGPTAS